MATVLHPQAQEAAIKNQAPGESIQVERTMTAF
jgi:hypothetical protein